MHPHTRVLLRLPAMLHASRLLLLLGLRVLLLRLLACYACPRASRPCLLLLLHLRIGEHVREARLTACEREGGSTARVPVLTLATCSTMGDQAWWCRGALLYDRWVLTRSDALHAGIHFLIREC